MLNQLSCSHKAQQINVRSRIEVIEIFHGGSFPVKSDIPHLSSCQFSCKCVARSNLRPLGFFFGSPTLKLSTPNCCRSLLVLGMNKSNEQTFCHICREVHPRPNLMVVAKSEQNEKRVSFVLNSNDHCLQKLKTLEAFKEAEAKFCNRKASY